MSGHDSTTPLTRARLEAAGFLGAAAPVRIVHLGLGAFHRAHQAWYTGRASDADRWGIAAFSGRSAGASSALSAQGGVFTLVERSDDGDRFEHVASIVRALPASDYSAFLRLVSAPTTSVLTLTVTEAAYELAADGSPDLDDHGLIRDMALVRAAVSNGSSAAAAPSSVVGKLLLGLEARRRAHAPGLAVVPCDNFPGNGTLVKNAVLALAASVSDPLAEWISRSVGFVSTSVDRITPRVDAGLSDEVAAATGWRDVVPVATEPFSDWTLSGDFPSGHPDWEAAGAVFVDDIEPYENRKLWLLNGAHTLLASLGRLRGHRTVADAMRDDECARAVNAWWDDAARQLDPELDIAEYRTALVRRFRNPRIEHSLAQIAADSITKLRLRIVPVARVDLAQGRRCPGAVTAIAAWVATIMTGIEHHDSPAIVGGAASARGVELDLLSLVAPDLLAHASFANDVVNRARALSTSAIR